MENSEMVRPKISINKWHPLSPEGCEGARTNSEGWEMQIKKLSHSWPNNPKKQWPNKLNM